MTAFLDVADLALVHIVEACTILLEFFGVVVLISVGVRSFVQWIRHDTRLRLDLAKGIALSLEFKMGSEVLRTVVVRDWSELGILGAVIILRGLLTFLIYWEIRHEEKALESLNKPH